MIFLYDILNCSEHLCGYNKFNELLMNNHIFTNTYNFF